MPRGGNDLSALDLTELRLPDRQSRVLDETAGSLQVRLAETREEVEAALALRYQVFYEEMKATPSPDVAAAKMDFDEFDAHCEHLLVIDRDRGVGAAGIVGTYRMMRREGAEKAGRFYTSDEYDIDRLLNHAGEGELLEMGRSCVASEYRTRAAMQIMWRGVTAYVIATKVNYLFGCASFHGTDPSAHALPLAYLFHNHLAPEEIRPVSHEKHYVDMNLIPAGEIDAKEALRRLPPIIKGYLRLGGVVGDGAYIDWDFNTVDVCVIVQIDKVTDKYFRHYTRSLSGENGSEG